MYDRDTAEVSVDYMHCTPDRNDISSSTVKSVYFATTYVRNINARSGRPIHGVRDDKSGRILSTRVIRYACAADAKEGRYPTPFTPGGRSNIYMYIIIERFFGKPFPFPARTLRVFGTLRLSLGNFNAIVQTYWYARDEQSFKNEWRQRVQK